MPSQVTNYKCPACTGPLHFESSTGKMECEYCGSVFTVNEIEALYEAKDEQATAAFQAAAAQSAADDDEIGDSMDVNWDLANAGSSWGAEAEGHDRGDELPLLRQPDDRAGPVCRHAASGSGHSLPA